jgi:hypothetical protein
LASGWRLSYTDSHGETEASSNAGYRQAGDPFAAQVVMPDKPPTPATGKPDAKGPLIRT